MDDLARGLRKGRAEIIAKLSAAEASIIFLHVEMSNAEDGGNKNVWETETTGEDERVAIIEEGIIVLAKNASHASIRVMQSTKLNFTVVIRLYLARNPFPRELLNG